MHFVAFVITEQKPTEEILHAKLAPLGGRYTGNIVPFD
jgi:hypothetical protein